MPEATVPTGADLEDRVWRPLVLSRIGVGGLALLTAVVADGMTYGMFTPCTGDGVPKAFQGQAFIGGLAALCLIAGAGFLSGLSMYVKVTDQELTVRNLFWRTRTVPLAEIAEVEPGFSGLEVRLRDGQELVGVAVQTSNWRMWFGRPGRGGAIADELKRRAEQARPDGAPDQLF